jgi:hypothetical protein
MKASRVSWPIGMVACALLAGCATAGHPCFNERAMFADRSSSCQYGRLYQCDNGDWIAARKSCTTSAPELASAAPLGTCDFGGISFANGSASCNAGLQYRCDNGRWTSLNQACPVTAGDAPLEIAPYGASCTYEGATVASSSAICQSGTTFVCNNGQWVNLGTLCR